MPELDQLLFDLLENLTPADWEKQTIAPAWKVKDVAVHLLDGNLRTLSMLRDGYYGEKAENLNTYADLVGFLNRLNAEWVKATRRLSPNIILELLKISGKAYCEYLSTLNPDENAVFAVAWAGEAESKNWFHIAREYTEKWHHQQQIRLAVGAGDLLLQDKWYLPYLDTSLRALPHHYSGVEGKNQDLIKFTFVGESEKSWYMYYEKGWQLLVQSDLHPVCEVRIPDEIAWKIFTRGISRAEALKHASITGNQMLGQRIFELIAVMA